MSDQEKLDALPKFVRVAENLDRITCEVFHGTHEYDSFYSQIRDRFPVSSVRECGKNLVCIADYFESGAALHGDSSRLLLAAAYQIWELQRIIEDIAGKTIPLESGTIVDLPQTPPNPGARREFL